MSPSDAPPDEPDNGDISDADDIESRWQAIVAELSDLETQTKDTAAPQPAQPTTTVIYDARSLTAEHFTGPRNWEVADEDESIDSFVPPQEFEPLNADWKMWAAWLVIAVGTVVLVVLLLSANQPAPGLILAPLLALTAAIGYLLSRLPSSDEPNDSPF